jgi:hypothetical protein
MDVTLRNQKDENGALHGPHEVFHGKMLWYRHHYNHGERHGMWERYYSDGSIIYHGLFHHGVKRGPWVHK